MNNEYRENRIENYKIKGTEERDGRGIYYKANVIFNDKMYGINVTRKEFELLGRGKLITPILFKKHKFCVFRLGNKSCKKSMHLICSNGYYHDNTCPQ